jgi:DNA-binding MarR family transcriptional regulator
MSAVQDDSGVADSGPADGGPVHGGPGCVQTDADITEAFGELFEQMVERVESVARRFEMPAFCLKALHMLNAPMAMKELGQRIHCDPSFVTSIADLLDSRGLGRREPDARDRRIKRLLLTPKGVEFRERVECELFGRLPWTEALDPAERTELLRLLRKMIEAVRGQHTDGQDTRSTGTLIAPPVTSGGNRAGEVTRPPSAAAPVGH